MVLINSRVVIKKGRVTAAGRDLLRKIDLTRPKLYAQVEKYASYPNQDDYKTYQAYDNAVDRAELRVLNELMSKQNPTIDGKAVNIAPTPAGYAKMFALILQGSDKKGTAWAKGEMIRIYKAHPDIPAASVNIIVTNHIKAIRKGGGHTEWAVNQMANIFTTVFK